MLFNSNILFDSPEKIFYLISNIIASFCVSLIFIAVLIDFVEFQKRSAVKKEKKSIVETGTMFLFFLFFYILIRFSIGKININFLPLKFFIMTAGLLILIIGCAVNIKGRINLGRNWSNQIKIYKDHYFVSNGVYSFVRHPLYASIIWMFFGASLVYSNFSAFLANILIFIPFMYYRAKQEENLLVREFENYKNYQIKTWMFFPKTGSKIKKL
ncbi:MAG: isoprenylcysteine carboxylmethyltransferase family protein [bacterium]